MEKRILNYIGFIAGIILLLLGLLWFLQGSDLVHIKPILCFANCTPITGKSMTWQIVGGVVFIMGAIIVYKNLKKVLNK
jgi:hypothetical protein